MTAGPDAPARCGNCHPEQLGPHDQREVAAFQRFLAGPGQAGPGGEMHLWRDWPGWVPYVLGRFHEYRGGMVCMHPPIGFDAVPVTAWTFPG